MRYRLSTRKHNSNRLHEIGNQKRRLACSCACCSKEYAGDIVDVIIKIMDDGPKPMRNFRPAEKLRNGAERFNCAHQEEYEARGRPSNDRVTRVHRHNTAYPKLKDELDRKHSVTKTNAISTTCVQLSNSKRRSYSKRRKVSKNKTKKKDHRSRITKPKTRGKRAASSYRLCRIRMNKCCQCTNSISPENKKSAATSDISLNLNTESSRVSADESATADAELSQYENDEFELNNYESRDEVPRNYTEGSQNDLSDDNTRIHDTSEPSVSSYNSFMSMDHEPMVEQE